MLSDIKINSRSDIPKYIQVTESVLNLIEAGQLKMGEKLPSINEAFKKLGISRDTLINAYAELKARGVIASHHGKGFYIASTSVARHLRVFLLFDVMNGYKAILYRSIINHLGENCTADIYFHHYNRQLFEELITNSLGRYSIYIIMPHFNENVSGIASKIPADKLVLIDNDIPALHTKCSAVYQNFEADLYGSLRAALDRLVKYRRFFMVLNHEFQFIPTGMVAGFTKFCAEFRTDGREIQQLADHHVRKGDAYLVFSDNDLIDLIKIAQHKQFILGKDIGIISYDETPLKEVLAGGITVISTDFRKMGEIAAYFALNRIRKRIANPCQLILRNSL